MNELSVGIWVNNIDAVKELAKCLRTTKALVHFCPDYSAFLEQKDEVTLNIVETILAKEYLDNSLETPLVLHSDEEEDCGDLFHYGILVRKNGYIKDLKVILERVNRLNVVAQKCEEASLNNHRTQLAFNHYRERIQNQEGQTERLRSIFQSSLEIEKKYRDFYQAWEDYFFQWKELSEFSSFILNVSGNKLISAPFTSSKHRKLPPLVLGERSSHGINQFGQNLGIEVALELMGKKTTTVRITGQEDHPDLLLFLSLEAPLNRPEEHFFETILNSTYRRFLLSRPMEETRMLHSWALMDRLGHCENEDIIEFNFTDMLKYIDENPRNSFYWQQFFEDFCRGPLGTEGRVGTLSLRKFLFILPRGQMDLDQCWRYSRKFPYWRYFEDADAVMMKSFDIKVTNYSPKSLESLQL